MQHRVSRNPSQVVVVGQPDGTSSYKNMNNRLARQVIVLGIVQILIGTLCIIFQGISLGVYMTFPFQGNVEDILPGFWTGLLFVITGIFGITAGIKRNRCQVLTLNILSIVSASVAAVLIMISIPGTHKYLSGQLNYCTNEGVASRHLKCTYLSKETYIAGIAVQAMVPVLAIIEGIIAIWSSVVCCMIGACCDDCGGICCCPPSSYQNQFAMTGPQRISAVSEED